jgi:hypothetical protein
MSATSRIQPVRLGLRANLGQFALLVGVNALVGGMVGQERSVLPLLATEVFGLTGVRAILTYLLAFGVTKAGANLLAGALADRYGRKPVLLAGWLIGLPVPLLLIWAPAWGWIVAANVPRKAGLSTRPRSSGVMLKGVEPSPRATGARPLAKRLHVRRGIQTRPTGVTQARTPLRQLRAGISRLGRRCASEWSWARIPEISEYQSNVSARHSPWARAPVVSCPELSRHLGAR